ncbi:MAG: DUF4337 domain-containing protein [Actinomycetota bacterium]
MSKAKEIAEGDEHSGHGGDKKAALYISILAVLLAITNLGGNNATKDFMASYIGASDTYNFFQAKSIRQTSYEIAADELRYQLRSRRDMPADMRAGMEERLANYERTVARYESDPDKGEGKKELLARARQLEQQRDVAAQRDPYFDYANALFEIAIVTASIATMLSFPGIMAVSVVLAGAATFMMINGYTLLVAVPGF